MNLINNFVFVGPANNFGGNLSPTGAQNQGHNSWASSGASAFASSGAGSKFLIRLLF